MARMVKEEEEEEDGKGNSNKAPKRRKLQQTWPLFRLNRVQGSGVESQLTIRIQVWSGDGESR